MGAVFNVTVPANVRGAFPTVYVGTNGSIKNTGPGAVYYRDEQPVDSGNNDGTISAGSTLSSLSGQYFLNSNTGAVAIITVGDAVTGAQGPAGPPGADGAEGPAGADGAPGDDAIAPVTLNTQTGDYTLVLTDAFVRVQVAAATTKTVTIPPNASVAFTTGTVIEIAQRGIGSVAIAPGSGVTLNSPDGLRTINHQFGSVSLVKVGTNEWDMVGDLS